MRTTIMGLLVLGGLGIFATPGQAQIAPNLNDPFYQYYAWFLPRQAAMASQPRVNDQINAVAAARADVAMSERQGLYDPVSPFALDKYDPSQPFRREAVRGRTSAGGFATTNTRGQGDTRYFNRSGGYHPTARYYVPGRSVVPPNRSRGMGGMGGVPGMGGMGGMGVPTGR
ncbi:MAG: hypothetical protein U0800_11940 [Isosphaeraceae bacterium]